MLKVGITGGIGSGKTTVCKIFEQLGIPIYYADERAKRLMTFDKYLKSAIKQLLGPKAYYRNGRLDRKYVASIVFNDKSILEKLNKLVHPAVGKDAEKWHNNQDAPYTIKEAALLVENGSYKSLDRLIVVTAPEELRIKRVIARDGSNYESVSSRIRNQLPEKEKKKVADFIIDNSGEVSLIQQIYTIHHRLLSS